MPVARLFVIRSSSVKVTAGYKFSLPYLCPRQRLLNMTNGTDSRGASCQWPEAEIRPVEPEQGNACAGKDAKLLLVSQLLPQINFLTIKKSKR